MQFDVKFRQLERFAGLDEDPNTLARLKRERARGRIFDSGPGSSVKLKGRDYPGEWFIAHISPDDVVFLTHKRLRARMSLERFGELIETVTGKVTPSEDAELVADDIRGNFRYLVDIRRWEMLTARGTWTATVADAVSPSRNWGDSWRERNWRERNWRGSNGAFRRLVKEVRYMPGIVTTKAEAFNS